MKFKALFSKMKEFLNTYLFPYIKHSDIVEYEGINNSDEGELISVQESI